MAAATKSKLPDRPSTIPAWEQAIDWSEDFKLPSGTSRITFRAPTFQAWVDAMFPQLTTCPAADRPHRDAAPRAIPVGKFLLYRLALPTYQLQSLWLFSSSMRWERSALDLVLSGNRRGEAAFDDTVTIPVLAEPRRDGELKPWMSMTPNEVISQRGMLRRSRGRTAIAGLGMGWMARRVLERKQVAHLTIVERDPDVLRYFGEPLQTEFGDRVTLVEGDAYAHDWDAYDVSLWDIWPGVGDAAWDRKFLLLQDQLRRQGRVCEGWTCWACLQS